MFVIELLFYKYIIAFIIGGVLEKDSSYNNALSIIVHNKQNFNYDKNKALLGVYISKIFCDNCIY